MGVLFRSLATAFVVTCSLAASKRSSGQEESYLPAAVGKRADAAGDALPAEARVRLGTVRFRHTNTFRSVAFTADGKQLATGGWGGACLWDAATGHVIRRYGQELPQAIQGASLSPDGKLIAVGGWSQMEGGGGVYELDSGRRLYRFGTGGIHATGLFSPDGKILAAFPRNDGAVVLFDAATGKELKALERHDLGRGLHMDGDAAFFPNGETLISALGDGMRFWDVASGKLLKHLDPPDGVAEMALAPTGQVIATIGRKTEKDKWGQTVTSRRTEIVLLDAATGKELRRIPAPPLRKPKHIETGPNFIAFSPSGRELVAGCAEGTFRVWDTATGKELRRFLGDCYLHGVAFRPDNRMALIEGHSLRLRDFNTGVDLAPSVGHREEISAMFSPDGSLVATREPYNRSIVLWDARTGRELRRLKSDNEAFRSTVLAPDSKTLLAITYDQEFWIWDVATGTLKHRRKVPGAYVLAQTRDGKTLAVSSDKSIVLLSPADGSELHTLSAEGKNITGMAFTPDGKSLVAWSHPDGKLHHWDLATGRHSSRDFYKLENYPFDVEFSPDGRLVTFGVQNSKFLPVVDLTTGKEVCRFPLTPDEPSQNLTFVAFSPDSRTLAWGGRHEGSVWLGEIASGEARHRLVGHGGRVYSVSWSADGGSLVTGSADTTALVWDLTGPLPRDAGRGALMAAESAALWEQLAKREAAPAYQAMRRLAADPKASVDFFAPRLAPAPPVDRARIKRLIASLDDADFANREQATRALLSLGDLALPSLRDALKRKPLLEATRRLERLIEQIEVVMPESLRAIRAVETLERIGTSAAHDLLRRLAHGAAEARLTSEARNALLRFSSSH